MGITIQTSKTLIAFGPFNSTKFCKNAIWNLCCSATAFHKASKMFITCGWRCPYVDMPQQT
uniref:Uncharacterized protein n=1 Tax=Lotus japonicus TaxID=34305 RepID=I3SVJ5_LOTJA|nr:unknown [Lotus japonicus]